MRLCDIHAGLLRHLITIERATSTRDALGGLVTTWTSQTSGGVKAHVKPLAGYELWAAQRTNPLLTVQAFIRFRADANQFPFYSPNDRVLWNTRYFSITSVIDLEYAHKWLQLDLTEGEPT